jgi:hypothetical protein
MQRVYLKTPPVSLRWSARDGQETLPLLATSASVETRPECCSVPSVSWCGKSRHQGAIKGRHACRCQIDAELDSTRLANV